MINLYSKEDFLNSLIEARKESFASFSDTIELAKSIYGKRFASKVWEYFNINIEYSDTMEGITLLDEAISSMMDININESNTNKK